MYVAGVLALASSGQGEVAGIACERFAGTRASSAAASAAAAAARARVLRESVGRVSSAVAGALGREVSSDEPLMAAGLDSLGATELQGSLSSSFGVELPATLVFDYPTVDAIGQYVAGVLAPSAMDGDVEALLDSADAAVASGAMPAARAAAARAAARRAGERCAALDVRDDGDAERPGERSSVVRGGENDVRSELGNGVGIDERGGCDDGERARAN